ncbi:ABC transporter permease subunit [Clostridium sp. BJN0013]|uniref:ABC transporter permease subunit n=1 Tax=Clostridium sp. BJN0013 TaxID=3236840 RepID=UPI0034C6AFE1
MSIFYLELKRVLRTRSTWILLLAAILLTGIMAYFPISYVHYTYVNKNGKQVSISGIKAIEAQKGLMVQGKITPDKIHKAVENYQEVTKKYGSIYSDNIPQDIYNEKILPVQYIIYRLESVYADPNTKAPADLSKISPEEAAANFYKKYTEQIKGRVLDPVSQKKALSMYEKVDKPFKFIYGYGSSDAGSYLIMLIFLLVIICTFITAPIFSAEYQTGADSILRCTKYGKAKLSVYKVISAILICSITFAICISVFSIIENRVFGWDSLRTSLQSIGDIYLPAVSVGETEIITAGAGMLTLIAVVSFTLFLSARCKNTANSIIISIVFCILPHILSSISGSNIMNWIRMILPSGGTGLGNSFGCELVGLTFLKLGSFSLWAPYVVIGAAIISIPLFVALTILSYCKHELV